MPLLFNRNYNERPYLQSLGSPLFNGDFIKDFLERALGDSIPVNSSLLFHKYPWWYRKTEGGHDSLTFKQEFRRKGLDYDKEMLHAMFQLSGRKPTGYKSMWDRHYRTLNKLPPQKKSFQTVSRIIVGSSGATVYETDITLHPFYGFPVIPGSAIKGVTRHYCEKELKLDKGSIVRLFGSDKPDEGKEGEVVFYDAWPHFSTASNGWGKPLLEIDILNTHYPYYYRNQAELPIDNQKPNIVKFLSVSKGVVFDFAVRPSYTCRDEDILSEAIDYIKETLENIGIGAKTGSGYGYFVEVSSNE